MKLRSYLNTWLALLTSVRDYWVISARPTTQLLGFFIISCLVMSLSQILYFQTRVIPNLSRQVDLVIKEAVTHFPASLEVTWNNSQLSSNITQPLPINYPSLIEADLFNLPRFAAYYVPTTDELAAIPSEVKDSTWTIITPHQIWLNNQADQWSSWPLSAFINQNQSWALNQATLPSLTHQAKNQVNEFLIVVSNLAWVFIPAIFVISRLWQTVLQTLLIYFLLKLHPRPLSWNQTWKMCLLITLVATLVQELCIWLYPDLSLPIFTLSFWCIGTLVLLNRPNLKLV